MMEGSHMESIEKPEPAALLIGVISGDREFLGLCHEALERFGSPAATSPVLPFNFTRYYEKTMGTDLYRRFLIYPKGFRREELADLKILTGNLEKELGEKTHLSVPRPVNIDPGYLTPSKLILASTKDHAHRIYLGKGIYAEVTLRYQAGSFRGWPWTYPDYASKEYLEFFNGARNDLFGKKASL